MKIYRETMIYWEGDLKSDPSVTCCCRRGRIFPFMVMQLRQHKSADCHPDKLLPFLIKMSIFGLLLQRSSIGAWNYDCDSRSLCSHMKRLKSNTKSRLDLKISCPPLRELMGPWQNTSSAN